MQESVSDVRGQIEVSGWQKDKRSKETALAIDQSQGSSKKRKEGNLPAFTESTVCQLWQVDDGGDGGGDGEGRRETSKDRRQRLQT